MTPKSNGERERNIKKEKENEGEGKQRERKKKQSYAWICLSEWFRSYRLIQTDSVYSNQREDKLF